MSMRCSLVYARIRNQSCDLNYREMLKKHTAKKMTLHLAFVDTEKAFDGVPIEGDDEVGHE